MVGVAEMLTFAFGFWVGTGVGVTLDFFYYRGMSGRNFVIRIKRSSTE